LREDQLAGAPVLFTLSAHTVVSVEQTHDVLFGGVSAILGRSGGTLLSSATRRSLQPPTRLADTALGLSSSTLTAAIAVITQSGLRTRNGS
jgi:hypothetical protein